MKQKEYVWYAGYGSNLYRERFLFYIVGGLAPGANEPNSGCTDKTLPIQELPHIIHHQLYFAKKSSKWQDGGLGLVRIEANPAIQTICSMYLITREQFVEIVRQENGNDNSITIDFDSAMQNHSLLLNTRRVCRNLLFVGYKDEYPIFTFTSSTFETPSRRPSEQYLQMYMLGLLQTHHLTKQQIIDYLISKDGITNNYTIKQLTAVFDSMNAD